MNQRRMIVVPVVEEEERELTLWEQVRNELLLQVEQWQFWLVFTAGATLGFLLAPVAHFLWR